MTKNTLIYSDPPHIEPFFSGELGQHYDDNHNVYMERKDCARAVPGFISSLYTVRMCRR